MGFFTVIKIIKKLLKRGVSQPHPLGAENNFISPSPPSVNSSKTNTRKEWPFHPSMRLQPEQLVAEKMHYRDANQLSTLVPQLLVVMNRLAIFDFCTRQILKLSQTKQNSFIIRLVWWLASFIAALLNINSAYFLSPGDWDGVRLPIAAFISFILVFFADWVISSEISHFLMAINAHKTLNTIKEQEYDSHDHSLH